jgi:class 3 adenylate cyclase/tetratricopeptide (TPR) repeat protein
MKRKLLRLWILFISFFELFLGFSSTVYPQARNSSELQEADTAFINKLLQQSRESLNESPEKAIAIAQQAKDLSEKAGFQAGDATALKNIGLGYYYQGKYLETLDYWNQSLKIFDSLNDQNGVANLLNNIGAVYTDQGDDAKGLEYSLKSLEISEKTGDKLRLLSALHNVGTIYYNKSEGAIEENKKINLDKALKYLLMALPLCEDLKDDEALGVISGNIGEIYLKKGDDNNALEYFNKSLKASGNTANSSFAYNGIGKLYLHKQNFNKALQYHQQAYDIAKKLSNQINMVRSLQGIANVYIARKDFKQALIYYNQAKDIAEEMKSKPDLKDIYEDMSLAYENAGDYKNAYKYQFELGKVKDTLFNETTERKLGALQFEFDLQKKQGQIDILTKDKALQDSQIKRQRFTRNALIVGLVLVFIIAFITYRDNRIKIRTNRLLDKQKDEIEHLLLNILPSEVAQELQKTGVATPKYYEKVSVLFTDFKSFSKIADSLSPHEIVSELNACFMVFDDIIEKYNLEKIKTIGDSYMCAGGIPAQDERHHINIVKASLEIQEFIRLRNEKRKIDGMTPWDVRIGINVGPLVAGVVGRKKYAYDIWGGTVNVASRMESNGEPGRVNISAATYELIKDEYACTYRGKIFAKNIGEIDMYYVDHEINNGSGNGIGNGTATT